MYCKYSKNSPQLFSNCLAWVTFKGILYSLPYLNEIIYFILLFDFWVVYNLFTSCIPYNSYLDRVLLPQYSADSDGKIRLWVVTERRTLPLTSRHVFLISKPLNYNRYLQANGTAQVVIEIYHLIRGRNRLRTKPFMILW